MSIAAERTEDSSSLILSVAAKLREKKERRNNADLAKQEDTRRRAETRTGGCEATRTTATKSPSDRNRSVFDESKQACARARERRHTSRHAQRGASRHRRESHAYFARKVDTDMKAGCIRDARG